MTKHLSLALPDSTAGWPPLAGRPVRARLADGVAAPRRATARRRRYPGGRHADGARGTGPRRLRDGEPGGRTLLPDRARRHGSILATGSASRSCPNICTSSIRRPAIRSVCRHGHRSRRSLGGAGGGRDHATRRGEGANMKAKFAPVTAPFASPAPFCPARWRRARPARRRTSPCGRSSIRTRPRRARSR